jgi:hypothetical protein
MLEKVAPLGASQKLHQYDRVSRRRPTALGAFALDYIQS